MIIFTFHLLYILFQLPYISTSLQHLKPICNKYKKEARDKPGVATVPVPRQEFPYLTESENRLVEFFDLFQSHITRIAGGADIGESLLGKTGYVVFGNTEFGKVLGYANL